MSLSLRMTISLRLQGARVVHRLVGHARRHGAVADDRDDRIVAVSEVARDRHAEARGDRGRGMGGAEWVVFALGAFGEARETAALPERANTLAPPGQDLMRIGLMADVPDQSIARRVEDIVQGDREFDDAESGPEMAAGDRYRGDRLGAQFVRERAQVAGRQLADVIRSLRCGRAEASSVSSIEVPRWRAARRAAAKASLILEERPAASAGPAARTRRGRAVRSARSGRDAPVRCRKHDPRSR